MSIELKIKSKHLSEEARIIKHEEKKLKNQVQRLTSIYGSELYEYKEDGSRNWFKLTKVGTVVQKRERLAEHRRTDVRNENRSTFLARAFIRGQAYRSVEQKSDLSALRYNILPRTLKMIQKYHDSKVTMETLLEWVRANETAG